MLDGGTVGLIGQDDLWHAAILNGPIGRTQGG